MDKTVISVLRKYKAEIEIVVCIYLSSIYIYVLVLESASIIFS